MLETWKKFVSEGIQNGEHDLKYYAFDWDDNIVVMPTKIILIDKNNQEVGMSSEDFAEYRSILGKEDFEYEGHIIKGYAPEPYRNFRPAADKQFLKDAMVAKEAPSWDDFVECLNSASIFSIITARGHRPSTLKRAVYNLIISNHNGIDSGQVYENIRKYNKIFKKTGRDASIKGYLDLCKFYPVSFNAGSMAKPEELKVQALKEFINYCKKLNNGMQIKMGFSDDDKKNMDLIETHFSEPQELVSMTFKYTGKHNGATK